MAKKEIYQGTGRRKESVARVRMTSGTGKIMINGRPMDEYLPHKTLIMDLKQPLEVTKMTDLVDIDVIVEGGGFNGQTGAIRLGIARALVEYDKANEESENSFKKILRANGFLTRDSRIVERKKPGLKKARKAAQFSKR